MNTRKNTALLALCATAMVLTLVSCMDGGQSAGQNAETSAGNDCSPQGALSFICGPVGSEDVVRVPESPYLLLSGLGLGQPGSLYLVDTLSKEAVTLDVAPAEPGQSELTGDCPLPPGLDQSSYSGLNLRRTPDGDLKVLAVNNGRRAVEFFQLDLEQQKLRWEGCAFLPANTRPNAVVSLENGDFLVTSFFDPTDPDAWQKMANAEPMGSIMYWDGQEGAGFTSVLADVTISGPNGIEISADETEIYVSAWASRELIIASRAGEPIRTVSFDFLPDNIHRQADGSLIIAGQRTQVERIDSCGRDCPQAWVVARVEPATRSVEIVLEGPGDSFVNYTTGATILDDTLFAAARGDNRIVYTRIGEGDEE